MSNKPNGVSSSGTADRGRGHVVNVGHGNFILSARIVAVLECSSLPMKRLREKASETGSLVDATAGRKMRSLIVTDSRHVIVSALAPQTLQERLIADRSWMPLSQQECEDGEFVS